MTTRLGIEFTASPVAETARSGLRLLTLSLRTLPCGLGLSILLKALLGRKFRTRTVLLTAGARFGSGATCFGGAGLGHPRCAAALATFGRRRQRTLSVREAAGARFGVGATRLGRTGLHRLRRAATLATRSRVGNGAFAVLQTARSALRRIGADDGATCIRTWPSAFAIVGRRWIASLATTCRFGEFATRSIHTTGRRLRRLTGVGRTLTIGIELPETSRLALGARGDEAALVGGTVTARPRLLVVVTVDLRAALAFVEQAAPFGAFLPRGHEAARSDTAGARSGVAIRIVEFTPVVGIEAIRHVGGIRHVARGR